MTNFTRVFVGLVLAAFTAAWPLAVAGQAETLGIVIMHGKGGSPTRLVADLARGLETKGYLVANLEMPWSGNRQYDVTTAQAEEEVAAAIVGLRGKGAKKVFVCGHSQGGVFALHLAGRLAADGFITIAPGGNVAARIYLENVGPSLDRARELIAEGKGNEPARLEDYEGARGTFPVRAAPAVYVTWFEPQGAMNMERAVSIVSSHAPILWIAPSRDYPGLIRSSRPLYRALPSHPLTRLYEPDADHRGAPSASVDEIVRWTREVANAKSQ